MWPLLLVFGAVVLVAGCGGETPAAPPPRRRPEHPDGGNPEFAPDGSIEDPLARQAADQIGAGFDLYVHGQREGREGCGTIRVQNIQFTPNADGQTVSVFAEGRWASYRTSQTNNGQVPSDVAYRAGDFPISWFTQEYPEYGTLGLKYLVTGNYDVTSHRLRLTLENVDEKMAGVSGTFLSALYGPWTDAAGQPVTCLADDSFDNEFFLATPARETDIPLTGPNGQASLTIQP